MAHLPDYNPESRTTRKLPEKLFVWQVIATLRPDFVARLVADSAFQRDKAKEDALKAKKIVVVDEMFLAAFRKLGVTHSK